jgi:hypothetical protein
MTFTDLSDSSDSEEDSIGPSSQDRKSSTFDSQPKFKQQPLPSDDHSPTAEEDISAFKRVLQEIRNNLTMFTPDLDSTLSQAGSFDGSSDDYKDDSPEYVFKPITE